MRIADPPDSRPLRRGGLGLALLAAWTALVFVFGAATQATSFFGVMVPILEGGPQALSRWLASRLTRPERLALDLKPEAFRRLERIRERHFANPAFPASKGGSVPATLRREGGEKVRVDLRLKADPSARLGAEKGAFEVHVLREASFLGMRRFSLLHPGTRNYAAEWLYHRALQREDVLALRYRFVDLSLNGTHLGVYALAEQFDRLLVEHARRSDGPILYFDALGTGREAHDPARQPPVAAMSGYGSYEESAIRVFRAHAARADPGVRELHLKAVTELEAFRRGERSVAEVFDSQRLARYFALADLLGAEHGTRWHNLRFYWNPFTSRLEPIGFEAECSPTTELSSMERGRRNAAGRPVREARPFHERVFADPAFHALYVAELARVSDPAYLDKLLAELGPDLREAIAVLDREFPNLEPPEALLRRNQAYLRSLLEPVAAPSLRHRAPATRERTAALEPHPAGLALAPDPTRLPANVERFDFLVLARDEGTLDVRPGYWTIERDLVVPPGLRLRAGAGTTLDLVRGARIFSRSPIELRGRKDAPVAIISSDRTGQGLVLLQAGSPSLVDHARFEGLRGVREPGWSLTGAVTFYESPVAISASAFLAIDAERALHVIRTRAAIDGTTMHGVASDALGCDFCDVEITDSRFANVGNDAIEVSGGTARVDDVEVEGAGGEGIGAGEASHLVATRVRITRANIAMAARDRSTLRVRDLLLRGCNWAVAAFRSKPEFGPAEVRVDGVRAEAMTLRHLVQTDSRVIIDGALLPPSPERSIREIVHGESGSLAARP